MDIVDAHHHFWDLGRLAYAWIPANDPVLGRSYGPADLEPALAAAGVGCTVLVQAHASLAETRWMLELAATHTFIAGVVGWADLTDPSVGAALDLFAAHPRRVGVRFTAADDGRTPWMARADVRRGLAELEKRELSLDLLIRPTHLPHLPRLAAGFPELRMVIDHLAKPPIATGEMEGWLEDMTSAAQCENVWCKLSGMITEADPAHWRADDLRPFVERVVELFGFDRLMFGSDWPVCRLAGSYRQVVDALNSAVGEISDSERAKLFGETARGFYGLKV